MEDKNLNQFKKKNIACDLCHTNGRADDLFPRVNTYLYLWAINKGYYE